MKMFGLLPFLVISTTIAPVAKADERPPMSMFENISGQEAQRIKGSEGNAERRGNELIIWLNGYSKNERGMIFRNWSQKNGPESDADGNRYVYAGFSKNYHIIREDFTHDVPMLYIIDFSGNTTQFHMGDDVPYMTKTGARIVSLRQSSISDAPLIDVIGWHQDKGTITGFEDEISCNTQGDRFAEDRLYSKIISLSDDDVTIQIRSKKDILGTMKLARDGWKWKVVQPETLWSGVTCG
jgi:hypothetical protein